MGATEEMSIELDSDDEVQGNLTLQLGIGGGIEDYWHIGEYIRAKAKSVGKGEEAENRKRGGGNSTKDMGGNQFPACDNAPIKTEWCL